MRIALITLALAALAFIGSIIWIFTEKNGFDIIPQKSTTETKISSDSTSLEILKSQWKTEERIKILEAKIDALGGKWPAVNEDPSSTDNPATTSSNQGNTNTNSGAVIIPISAKFLSKIITKVNLILGKNNGIFGLYVFDTISEYSTYMDTRSGITIIASRTPYATWLKNFTTMDTEWLSIKETKTFPFPSFYLNSKRPDEMVRIVMQVEAQTLLISIPKSKFEEFKTTMNKK